MTEHEGAPATGRKGAAIGHNGKVVYNMGAEQSNKTRTRANK